MNNERFNEIVESRIKKIRKILKAKGEEYSSEDNRLHNFEVAARKGDCSPEKALQGMDMKHVVSIQDIIDKCELYDNPELKLKHIEEKIGDHINYMILLEAILNERIMG